MEKDTKQAHDSEAFAVPADQLRIVPTLEIEATHRGQYAAITAAEAWNETHNRLDGFGYPPLAPGETGPATIYLLEDTTVHELNGLIHTIKPHIIGEPIFRWAPHFRQKVTQ